MPAAPRRTVRLTAAVLVPAALATLIAMIMLWPGGRDRPEEAPDAPRVAGQVLAVGLVPCPLAPDGSPASPSAPTRCGTVTVRLSDGQTITTEIPSGPGAPHVEVDDRVILLYLDNAMSGSPYHIVDHDRGRALWVLAAAFVLAVVAFGRWRGLAALAGLAVTFGVLLLFVVPAILEGASPLLVAIVGAAAVMLVVLYLTHGLSVTTSMAVLGTLVSLVLTGLLSAAATAVTRLSGVSSEESSFLTMNFPDVNMHGLLLAGILIGSLGVLDDVTVTQAYTVRELAHANPGLGFAELYRRAARVGRAHIASVINTIILAYAGASLPLLLLIAAGNRPLDEVLTNQLIAGEIVRSVVGTIGLIAAVPITTALAALAIRRGTPPPVRRPRRPDPLELAWEAGGDAPARPAATRP
ncbi:YibE/F family protein [Luedemannella helvata]|uniref:YibE/F family protein n=1 Tax=Luedemannella helvata TaxID=349315 RepID=UPI003CD0AD63